MDTVSYKTTFVCTLVVCICTFHTLSRQGRNHDDNAVRNQPWKDKILYLVMLNKKVTLIKILSNGNFKTSIKLM